MSIDSVETVTIESEDVQKLREEIREELKKDTEKIVYNIMRERQDIDNKIKDIDKKFNKS